MAICPFPVSYDHIHGVMALTLFEDFIYWTDGKSKSLRRAHKTTAAQGMELLNSWQAIKSIKVYHSLRQPEGITSICHSCPFGRPMLSCCMVVRGERFRLSFCPSVQYPNTSVRLQMEAAATCVSYPLVGGTNVLAPLIFTWLPTIRPACPTAPPVRSALPFFFPPKHFKFAFFFLCVAAFPSPQTVCSP